MGQFVDRRIQGNCHKGDLTIKVEYEITNNRNNNNKVGISEGHRP